MDPWLAHGEVRRPFDERERRPYHPTAWGYRHIPAPFDCGWKMTLADWTAAHAAVAAEAAARPAPLAVAGGPELRLRILAFVAEHGPKQAWEIAQGLGLSRRATKLTVWRLRREGCLRVTGAETGLATYNYAVPYLREAKRA